MRQAEDAEVDEMWSFAGSKRQQRWLWHAREHRISRVFAYVSGPRKDDAFVEFKVLLAPLGRIRFYTDGWGAYRRHLDPARHTVGNNISRRLNASTLHCVPNQTLSAEDNLFFTLCSYA
jgi:insertion element IS1 protein InsB